MDCMISARQHFGACAKCLTNAWRICKEGTPDAVEMKCSNGSTWWLCDYCLSKEQLTQRTAELEAVSLDLQAAWRREANLQAELERVRAERDEQGKLKADLCKRLSDVENAFVLYKFKTDELRKLIAALPKVEGEITCSQQFDSAWKLQYWQVEAYGVADECLYRLSNLRKEEANAYAAMLRHRQGMEG